MKSSNVHQIIGSSLIQWEENSPLKWSMQEPSADEHHPPITANFDLAILLSDYSSEFLDAFKEILIQSKHHRRLISIKNTHYSIRAVLLRVAATRFNDENLIMRIDGAFLKALHSIKNEIPRSYLIVFRSFFNKHRSNPHLFEITIRHSDFPSASFSTETFGLRIKRILAIALRRASLVHVLNIAETAFEEQKLDIGRYAFIRLALNIFCRAASYRQLTLADLRLDQNEENGASNYFLDVRPAKSRVNKPQHIVYRLHPEVGKLLALQRQAVVERYGHLAPTGKHGRDYGRLALFPALMLASDGTWSSSYADKRSGILPSSAFAGSYLAPLRALTKTPLTFNALRHTIGTQLAMMGCSSHTIQAVLKHASEDMAQSYVDIAFDGLIDELSDGLQPAFDIHFPAFKDFISSNSLIPPERKIESEDLKTNRVETTGMCGRKAACEYAPISCYTCPRFIPCYDADHNINLNLASMEIAAAEGGGRAMQHDVERWKTIRNSIRVVIAACALKFHTPSMAHSADSGVSA